MKFCYSFEDRGTDRQTESISEFFLKDFRMIYDMPTNAET